MVSWRKRELKPNLIRKVLLAVNSIDCVSDVIFNTDIMITSWDSGSYSRSWFKRSILSWSCNSILLDGLFIILRISKLNVEITNESCLLFSKKRFLLNSYWDSYTYWRDSSATYQLWDAYTNRTNGRQFINSVAKGSAANCHETCSIC